MARGMGHKRDLLRKMREPGFSPADLRDPSDLLEKANKLKGFVQQQNSRTGRSNAKKEWLLAAQALQDEREAAERELQAALQATSHDCHACPDLGRDTQEALASWQATTAGCSQLRQALREQIKGIAAVHASLKAYGVEAFQSEASAVQQEARSLRHHLEAQLSNLEAELASLTAEGQLAQGQASWDSTPSKADGGHTVGRPMSTASSSMQAGGRRQQPMHAAEHPGLAPPWEAAGPQGTPGCLEHSREELQGPPLARVSEAGGRSRRPSLSGRHEDAAGAAAGSCGRTGAAAVGACAGVSSGRASEVAELEELLRGFPLVRGLTKARVREVFHALRQQHEDKLEEWQREAQVAAEAADPQQRRAAQWPEDEHSWFVSMRERFWREMGPKGASREALMAKLASMMPKYSLPDLLAHDQWHQKHKLLLRRRHGLMEAWRREKAQFLEDSTALLQESTQIAVERAETAAERLVHELTRERVNEELQVLRAAAAEQAELNAASKAAAEAKAEKELAVATEASRAEQALKKEMVAAYKHKLEQQEAERAAAAAARAAAEERLHAQQAPYHKARTEARKLEYQSKQEHRRQAQEATAAEAQAREARLDKLRKLVAPHVEADPLRVLLPTEASMGVDDKGGAAFKDVNGYTVDQLYKDQRFKVMEALQRAGLHQTNYAREVISAMPAAKPTRPDNLTVLQRGLS